MNPKNLKNIPPQLVEELTQFEARMNAFVQDQARVEAERSELKAAWEKLADRLRPYCDCPKCRKAKQVKSDAQHGADVQNVTTIVMLLLITGFVIGYLCGVGR